ncbi:histidine kinase [Paramagnetospirillum kuznetsovii]|uniref:histidine kinase n=1 Tax=Paramagnetospirillum kuznetsovii TaxID=2053833 RepID=A0A364NZ71_9PROT|nr:histidine kinase [Paramagnetospirillum kuznetsovii]
MLLALWAFVGYWSWSQHQKVLASGEAMLEQLTSAVEEQTLRLFKQAETSLVVTRHWIAEHPDQDPGTAPSYMSLADSLRAISEGMLDIRLVSKDGGLFYVPKRGPKPMADVSDRDYVKAQSDPRHRGLYIGNPVVSRVTGKWGIPVSLPIDQGGGDVGVIFVAMELDRIGKTFEAERPKPNGAISIMRSDGTFLFRVPAGPNIIGQNIAGTPSWDEQISVAPRGTYYSDGSAVGTAPKLVSFLRLRDYPLIVTVASEVDSLLVPWRRESYTLIGLATLVSIVTAVLASVLLGAMKSEEAALRETEIAHRDSQLILSSAGEGICGIDSSGAISFINPAARKMLGLLGEDVVGLNLHAISHHSHPDGRQYAEADCPILRTLSDGGIRDIHGETFWHRNGTPLPVDLVVTGVVEDGKVSGGVLVFHDIGERIKAERRLEAQAAELARSNADLEQFAYVASHDLREPLRQVASYVSLLERRYAAQLDQDGRDFIIFARDGALRMNQLIIDLLEFSRIGHQSKPPEQVTLARVVDDACANLASHIEDTGARISRDDELPRIRGNQGDLVRVFQNLIGNALKYRDPGRAPDISITALRDGAVWVITISDNGIGFEAQFYDKIFGIFQRLHTRDKFEGTGIGLAICKKIVEGMGGRIRVDSTPGEGSRFSLVIPA